MPTNISSNVKVLRAISPVSVGDDTAEVSEIIDTNGFGSAAFFISTGGLVDANATFAVLIEDDTAAGFGSKVAVADAFLDGTEAGAGFTFTHDDEVRKIGYLGTKRYIRLTITPSGNASAALLAAVAVLGSPRAAPISQ